MMFGIVAGAGCVVLVAVAWWASGRARPRLRVDRPAALSDAEAVARSERTGFHPNSPGAGL
jgi:hypothetical protein